MTFGRFEIAFSLSKLAVNLLQTSIDELFGTQSYLVLVLIGLTVVAFSQLLKIVGGTFGHFVIQYKLCDSSSL